VATDLTGRVVRRGLCEDAGGVSALGTTSALAPIAGEFKRCRVRIW
jgi:hypothetical protein